MGLFNAVMALSGAADTDLIEQESLARHTSYRIGGKADLFLVCHSYHALRRALDVLTEEDVPWVIIGKGSNLLVADEGYRGAVVTLGREFSRMICADDGVTLTVGAGVILARLVNEALSRGLTGLEFAVGIPGTVGGAVSMNAGTRTEWMGSVIEDVLTLKPGVGLRHYSHDDVFWGYRSCTLPRDEIVLEATVKLAPGDKAQIRSRMERSLDRRRKSQPLGSACCGSVFKNPPDMSVGKMIEDCGLKGFSVGGAEVSPIHGNFIVNTGTARAEDVAAVIKKVHEEVRKAYGVELQPEVKFLGF
ncbi:UDP-N-acetylmuramate dehydrogenase [Collinsella sp. An307]|uniref:UDP-N-acetylmuramate dehydrogenase n=1 Tax=Collinsella sp. An307 TaxID=1965630 RepID=UPI000B3989E8|nr:UDP-N-acetylmuramate dehydrogenase [Collinsella sp. An307]OUO22476.1 UDP-N-acetylenolpyruvoylglucosamine reductase [Collinsella sp. An307]